MRGKGELPCPVNGLDRITPAYAGKSHCCISQTPRVKDHPRLCGEKIGGLKMAQDFEGSPPPMRGKEISDV